MNIIDINKKKIIVSIPGSIMLLGEHAVLYGYPSISVAINRRIKSIIELRNDKIIFISSKFGCIISKIQYKKT